MSELFQLAVGIPVQRQHPRHDGQFVLVQFQDVGLFERGADGLFAVKILPQVDVEHFETLLIHMRQQFSDRRGGRFAALPERTETYGVQLRSQSFESFVPCDEIPGYRLVDRVRRNAPRVEPHVDGAGRIVVLLYVCGAELSFLELFENLEAIRIVADRADDCRPAAELRRMECEVERRSAQLLARRQQVPQEFPDACYGECLFHTCKFSNPRGNCKRRPTFLFTGFCGSSARPIS